MRFPQFADWKELVEEDQSDLVTQLMKDYPEKFSAPKMPSPETLYPPPALYFDKHSQALAQMYNSSTQTGLTSELVKAHQEYYGKNQLPPPPKASLLKMLYAQFTDFMIIILIIVAMEKTIIPSQSLPISSRSNSWTFPVFRLPNSIHQELHRRDKTKY